MSTVVAGGELRIRPATNDDAEKISHVILQALRETNARDYPPHIIERLEQSFGTGTVLRMIADQTVFVAEADGNIVGTAGFDGKAVRSVFVAPQSQGLGVGRSLVHEVEYAARACQLETLRLNSSVTAESFYKKLGYAVVEEKLYGDERTIVMERHLSPRVGD